MDSCVIEFGLQVSSENENVISGKLSSQALRNILLEWSKKKEVVSLSKSEKETQSRASVVLNVHFHNVKDSSVSSKVAVNEDSWMIRHEFRHERD